RGGNTPDQDQHRSSEQPQREKRAERLEYNRQNQQGCKCDQDVAMPELQRLDFAPAGAFNPHPAPADHQGCPQPKWNKSGPGQARVSEIEPHGLPDEKQAAGAQHRGGENAAGAGAQAAWHGYYCFLSPRSVISWASFSSSWAISLPNSSAGRYAGVYPM